MPQRTIDKSLNKSPVPMTSLKESIDINALPVHIAIIMDGNRRWAIETGMDVMAGHKEGVISVRKVTEAATELGVKYLTLYTFSAENWNRSQQEVNFLMELLVDTIERETPDLKKNNVRILSIGDLEELPVKTREKMIDCIKETDKNTGLNLIIALNYSSRWEITDAVKKISSKVTAGELSIENINEDTVSEFLTTKGIPDPDLLIRTSGEERLSNFLLWQLAYTEFYFTEVYWPNFRKEEFYEAILEYQKRNRRFGK